MMGNDSLSGGKVTFEVSGDVEGALTRVLKNLMSVPWIGHVFIFTCGNFFIFENLLFAASLRTEIQAS